MEGEEGLGGKVQLVGEREADAAIADIERERAAGGHEASLVLRGCCASEARLTESFDAAGAEVR